MGRMQREKGKRWEREVARRFRDALPQHVDAIKRGAQQSRDGHDEADVRTPYFWPECKVGKAPPLMRALEQAEAEEGKARGVRAAGGEQNPERLVPVAVVKQDRHKPVALLRLDDFLELVRAAYGRNLL